MKAYCKLTRAHCWCSIIVGVMCLLSGCATSPAGKKSSAIFYPTDPDPPRLQFLTSYNSSSDLTGDANKFATFITGKDVPKNPIIKPYGVAINRGKIYVCDVGASAVQVLDLEKKKMQNFLPKGASKMRMPINMTIDTDGTCYIADGVLNQVLVFANNGTFVAAIGQKNTNQISEAATATTLVRPSRDDTMEMRPTDVAVNGDRLYVSDLKNHCVRVYDKRERKLLFLIAGDPGNDNTRLFAPANITVDAQGKLYVSDVGAFRVQVYDADGKYIRTIGKSGESPGEFARPKGVAIDRSGNLYVVDAAAQVVQIFDPEGKLLLFFGQPGASEASLDLPAKVAIDYDNLPYFQSYAAPGFKLEYLVLVTNQLGDRKISVYGFGHMKN